jgi:hypothetical protein
MQKSGKLFPHFSEIVQTNFCRVVVAYGKRQVCCNEKEKWMVGQKKKAKETACATCQWPSRKPSLLSGRSIFVFFFFRHNWPKPGRI